MIDDDELINNNINHHQLEPDEEKFPADLETVLGNLNLVFGDILSLDEVPRGTKPELAFAWICKINADIRRGGKIRNPIGLLRARLATRSKRKILHQDLLPDAYLRALGLEENLSPFSEDFLAHAIDAAARAEQSDAEAEAREIEECSSCAVPGEVLEAWHNFLNALRQELPRSMFETWVEVARPVRFDNGNLVVVARNEYAANWMAGKQEIKNFLTEYFPGATVEFTTVDKFPKKKEQENQATVDDEDDDYDPEADA